SPGYPPPTGRLLTCYAPVRHWPRAEARNPFDLHVLSAPPAFVLSQDQTLHRVEQLFRNKRCYACSDIRVDSFPVLWHAEDTMPPSGLPEEAFRATGRP